MGRGLDFTELFRPHILTPIISGTWETGKTRGTGELVIAACVGPAPVTQGRKGWAKYDVRLESAIIYFTFPLNFIRNTLIIILFYIVFFLFLY